MEESLKVLLIEDEKIDQMAFDRFVKHKGLAYDVTMVDSIPEAKSILQQQKFDIVLTDYFLGMDTGIDLLREIHDNTPCIIITGLGDEEIAVRALKLGAVDYISKDPQGNYLKTLPSVVENAIKLKRTETELLQYRQNLEKMVVERTEKISQINEQLSQEIIERKKTEDALRTSEDRVQQAVRVANIGIFDHDHISDTIFWSPEQRKHYGLGIDETVTLELFLEQVFPDDREQIANAVRRAHDPAGDGLFDVTHRIFRRDGTVRWITTRSQTFFVGDGPARHPARTVGAVIDITERKESETQVLLQASALDAALNGIIITNTEGKILWANPSFEEISGYSRSELTEDPPDFIRQVEQNTAHFAELLGVIQSGQPWRGEMHATRKDGVPFIVEMTVTPVFDAANNTTHFVAILQDITEKIHARERLEYQATHDVLTGLPNRLLFNDRLTHALAIAKRTDSQGAVILIDLDDFKAINDAFSHDEGDNFLVKTAERFGLHLRESDTIARIGGDEFVILIEDIDHKDAEIVANKINQILSIPIEIKGNGLVATASIGISMFPQDGDSIQVLLKNADLAMYYAKERKNSFQFYTNQMAAKVEKQLELTNYLRYALQNNIFQLNYQPQVDSATGRVVGVEALLRLPHPEKKWISPGEFIPLAEKTGLITDMDEWVLRTACKKIKELVDNGYPDIVMAVNVSNRFMGQPSLAEILAEMFTELNLDPGCLELEISESSVFQNLDATIIALVKLKSLGIKLAIDDFGTGYASLNYMTRFPLNTIKIDMTFTRKVLSSKSDAAIVSGVIAIANRLGLDIVVEGVEKEEQLEFYSNLNCHIIQGYYYSPAVSGDKLMDLLDIGFSPFCRD